MTLWADKRKSEKEDKRKEGKMKQKIIGNTDKNNYLFDNKALVTLIAPLIVEQLLTILVGMADSIMVASVGEAAVSGVSLVDQIMVLLINVFAALATGGAVVAGQYLGQQKKEQACKSVAQLIWTITIFSLVITVVVYLGKYWILHKLFGQIEADVMHHADVYLLIVTASVPFIALYNGGAAVFRSMGNSKISMKVSVLMNAINVCGNAILIYGFHRGTEGVAIPTFVSRIVAAVVIIILLMRKEQLLYLKMDRHFRPDWTMIGKILSVGIPNGLENSMFQLGKVLVLSLVSTFGTYAIAANAVSNTISLFSILPGMAICLAVTTVISRCVGAGDYEQAKYYNRKLILITHGCMAVTVAIVFAMIPTLLHAYNLSDAASEATRHILWFHGICAVLTWPESFVLPATFRAAGDAKACMIIATLSMWIFRVGFSYFLGKTMGWGVFGVWVAMIIDWEFRILCFAIRYFKGSWKKKALV